MLFQDLPICLWPNDNQPEMYSSILLGFGSKIITEPLGSISLRVNNECVAQLLHGVSAFLACRLIALDKCPGVRPIGIGETARRIVAKSVLSITRGDIQDAAGSVQLCTGQIAGVEAAVHAVRECFEEDDVEAALLVDASNAFNSLNRDAALHNIRFLCPFIATILINTYRAPTDLYFIDGEVIMSQEGTTQGDPLAMPMYAVATLPLIRKLPRSVRQTWYADDATALGAITNLRTWWDDLVTSGPGYGYFPNASKTRLVTKTDFHSEATVIFGDTNVNITSVGRPHLGAPLGTKLFAEQFVLDKVTDWSNQVKLLSVIATTQPHAAFAAFIHGMSSRWTFLARTVPNIGYLFKQLEDTIRTAFIPTITGQLPTNDTNRGLFGLPPRLGGLGLLNPVLQSDSEFSASLMVTKPLKELILRQEFEYPYEALADQITAKADVRQLRSHQASQAASTIKETLSPPLLRALDLAQEKGASNWLTSLPIEEYGFCLHKGAFTDALALRYGGVPSRTPVNCVCGTSFSVEHVLSCSRGGFPSIRHNEIRDLTADLLTNVCKDVRVEPDLMPVTNESLSHASANSTNGARLDIAANGLWGGRFERSYMDVRVLTLSPLQTRTVLQPATRSTKTKRNVPTNNG